MKMEFFDDTISAISTPRGQGGIGIVRMSGPKAIQIARHLFRVPSKDGLSSVNSLKSYTLNYGFVVDPETEEIVDEILLGVMKSPHSYTKEDVVEFNCHGGDLPLKTTLELTLRMGARLAEPGEFTKRAFINGRIDLAQAEAVIDLIRSKTDLSRQVAINQLSGKLSERIDELRNSLVEILAEVEASIDFPEEDLDFMDLTEIKAQTQIVLNELEKLIETANEGRILREGVDVAIVGRPNVGKSSLLNALLQQDRAIVTEVPGTTRDTVEEYINVDGIPLKLTDTAGLSRTEDVVEQAGIARTKALIEQAELLLALFDVSCPLTEDDVQLLQLCSKRQVIIVLNKIDLPEVVNPVQIKEHLSSSATVPLPPIVSTSMLTGMGLGELKSTIVNTLTSGDVVLSDSVMITNLRHLDALKKAKASLEQALKTLIDEMPPELLAVDLRGALDQLGIIIGTATTDDILDRIFSQFCIGK